MYSAADWLIDGFVFGLCFAVFLTFPYLPGCSSAKWD